MRLNQLGTIVGDEWIRTEIIRDEIQSDEYVIMPNHFHGIICINNNRRGTARRAPTTERFGKPVSGSIPTVIRSFKSAATKRINILRQTPSNAVWQRNYFERVLRNEVELHQMRLYISDNPLRWDLDKNNPINY